MLKRFILWDFPRASWQYDVMVGIILAFIFLTPRAWFRDQPRIPHASQLASGVVWLEPEVLSGIPAAERVQRAQTILKSQNHTKNPTVTRVEPIVDSEGETKGYM